MKRNPPQKPFVWLWTVLLSVWLFGILPAQANHILIDGLGGDAGFGELAMFPNDDGSSNELGLPFDVNFFGNTFDTFFINNNGNISFNGPVSTFTPDPFPVANQPLIAPYWGDVDTRCATCGAVYVGSPNAETTVVTWDSVGFFSSDSSLTNTFQLVLRDRSDTGAGNFDIEFRYEDLNWTTGDASGGSGGLGGTPAQAGFDAGDGVNFFTLPGSRTAAVLDLQNTSNVSENTPGLWSFAIREGGTPGSTPDNPLLPVVNNGQFVFDFNVELNQTVFIDPIVAIGYDYEVTSGPNFQTVLLPTGIGDDLYDLFLFDDTLMDYTDSGIDLAGGSVHNFGPGGVDRFRILGIETEAGLDPNDTEAFVTGVSFTSAGRVQMTQTPISFDTDPGGPGPIPEPSTVVLFATGLLGLGLSQWRKTQTGKN